MNPLCKIFFEEGIQDLVLGGVTAGGKSALAMEWAQAVGGVVVCCDAFQIYRGMSIGTGQPTVEDFKRVPHALYGEIDPTVPFSVAAYVQKASRWLRNEKRPRIWVAGTGLFARALCRGLCGAPASDPQILTQLAQQPLDHSVEILRQVDPEWCLTADLRNPRRVHRALAVWKQTGIPLSQWHRQTGSAVLTNYRVVILQRDPDELRQRIQERVHTMWKSGWPEETAALRRLEGWNRSTARKAVGYAVIERYLDGQLDAQEAREEIIQRTLALAKRQRTWWRREPDAMRIEAPSPLILP